MAGTDLKQWQDRLLEEAKRSIRRDGAIRPHAVIMTDKSLIPKGVLEGLKSCGIWEVKSEDGYCLVVDLSPTPENLITMLRGSLNPESVARLEDAIRLLEASGERDPVSCVVASFLLMSKIHPMSLILRVFQHALEESRAMAFVRVDEIKVQQSDGSGYRDALSVLLDASSYRRALIAPYIRNRTSGRVVDFEDIKEVEDKDLTKISGPFVGLLPQESVPEMKN